MKPREWSEEADKPTRCWKITTKNGHVTLATEDPTGALVLLPPILLPVTVTEGLFFTPEQVDYVRIQAIVSV